MAPSSAHTRHKATPMPLIRAGAFMRFMSLSPLSLRISCSIMEFFQKLFNGETRTSGAGHEVTYKLVQPLPALYLVATNLLRSDKGAGPLLGIQHAADFEFAV